MISQTAEAEYLDLLKAGINPTFGEIVRLNVAGLALERARSGDGAECFAPRVAWAGSTPLYQPTIQSEKWFSEFATTWWKPESATFALGWSMAHAQEEGFFRQWTNEKQTRRAILDWYGGLNCTREQFIAAISWAMFGDDRKEIDAYAQDGTAKASDVLKGCPYTSMIREAVASNLGLSLAEIERQTVSGLMDIMERVARREMARNGGDFEQLKKTLSDSKSAELFRIIDSIKKAHGHGE